MITNTFIRYRATRLAASIRASANLRYRYSTVASTGFSAPNYHRSRQNNFIEPSRLYRRMVAHASSTADQNGVSEKFERLPNSIKPVLYTLKLQPDLETLKCTGRVDIDAKITQLTNTIRLYAKEIDVKSATINGVATQVTSNEATESIILASKEPVNGDVKISIEFVSILNDKMRGFYRSNYKDVKTGENKIMASTQFESTYARQAFPCFDEPLFKAKFDVTLVVKDGLQALSNMQEVSRQNAGNGWTEVKFGTSPIMSSYLVAFAVGEFNSIETKTNNGTLVRLWAVNNKQNEGHFALDCSKKALEYYNDFFGIEYPLPKCDVIAIPDFSMGAMENWGLVTFREVLLQTNEGTSALQKTRVALVVAHELAHMWFGNLVTMSWWTDLWLKEGFATFMEYLFVSNAYPEFEIWKRFANDEIVRGLTMDGLHSSHPIEVEIDNPNELEEVYDAISYSKGASINGMVYAFLGHDNFRAALQNYQNTFKYSNATTNDLWKCLSDASKQDVGTMANTWTTQMGYPLVTASYDKAGKVLTVKQERFFNDGSKDPNNPLWHIPINVITKSHSDIDKPFAKLLLKEPQQQFPLDVADGEWIKLNAGFKGFYRVEYSSEMQEALNKALSDGSLSPMDRFNIVGDAFALAQAGKSLVTNFLSVVKQLAPVEKDLLIWEEMDNGIGSLNNVIRRATDEKLRDKFNKFIIELYEPMLAYLTWDPLPGETQQQSVLRGRVINRLGRAGHEATVAKSRDLFKAHLNNHTLIHPDIRRSVYGTVALHDGESAFETLMQLHQTSDNLEIQRTALLTLASGRDNNLHQRAMEFGIHSGKVRSQDLIYVFMGCASTKEGQNFIWNAFKDEMPKLIEIYSTANSALFQHCMQNAIQSHADLKFADEVKTFIESSKYAKTLNRPMRQSVETVGLNATLLKQCNEQLPGFFV